MSAGSRQTEDALPPAPGDCRDAKNNRLVKQVLIINVTRMGDLIQMGPLLARLEDEWPGVAVDLVVDRQFAPVAAMLPGLREVIARDFHQLIDDSRAAAKDAVALYRETETWAAPLRARGYDRVINLTFNRPSALLASYVSAPDIRGARSAWDGGSVIDNPWMAYFTDMHQFRTLNRFNLVDIYALGGSAPGTFTPLRAIVPPDAQEWARRFLRTTGAPATEWIAVQAGASDVMKAWRPQHFGTALARIGARWTGGILLIGAASEQSTIAQVMQVYREAGGSGVIKNAAGQTSLPQLAALLGECRLLLTNDTGPMHLAVAVGTPVIDLSVGHVDFRETGPYGPGHWVVQPELECAPCGFEQVCAHHTCKDRISAEFAAQLMWHALGLHDCPSAPGCRLYRSEVDEDELGTFRLIEGTEPPTVGWYAAYWRRYWYETFTGHASRCPAPAGQPPDAAEAAARVRSLSPLMERLCRRADEIARLVEAGPSDVPRLRRLQREQVEDRSRLVALGLNGFATAPWTAGFIRSLHNDNVEGLVPLSRYHAETYRSWRRRLETLRERMFGTETAIASRNVAMEADGQPAMIG